MFSFFFYFFMFFYLFCCLSRIFRANYGFMMIISGTMAPKNRNATIATLQKEAQRSRFEQLAVRWVKWGPSCLDSPWGPGASNKSSWCSDTSAGWEYLQVWQGRKRRLVWVRWCALGLRSNPVLDCPIYFWYRSSASSIGDRGHGGLIFRGVGA